jgi:hypothetical protein
MLFVFNTILGYFELIIYPFPRMVKSIKKRYIILVISLALLILIPASLFLLARSPKFQTCVANQITARLSNKLNTTISIGSIHFSFFNKLVVRDILLLDQNNDTLVYA